MKSLDNITKQLNDKTFDLMFESHMVQSRIVSVLLDVIDLKNLTQQDLEELTGLSQPFLSALFNNRKKLNVEHIAKIQNALGIVLQPPSYLYNEQHHNEYYREDEFFWTTDVCRFSESKRGFVDIQYLSMNRPSFEEDKHLKFKKPTSEKYEFA